MPGRSPAIGSATLIFCGAAQPEAALDTLVDLFEPREINIRRLNRGVNPMAEADDLLSDSVESA